MTNFYLPPDDPDLDKEYISGREYMNGIRTGVKTISSQMNTKVIFGGDGAATDGERVFLPQQDPDRPMTLRQVNVGRGYGNHEALHQVLTDMDAWKAWARDNAEKGLTWTTAMGNAIEDVRIEHGGLTLYPGIAKSIDHTAEEVTRAAAKQFEEKPELKDDMWACLPLATTWAGRVRLGYPSEALTSALDNLAPEIKDKAFKIADAVLGLEHGVEGVGKVNTPKAHQGTKAALELAELVSRELAKEHPPEEERYSDGGTGDTDDTRGDDATGGSGTEDGRGRTTAGDGDDCDKAGSEAGKPDARDGDETAGGDRDGTEKGTGDIEEYSTDEADSRGIDPVVKAPTPIDSNLEQVQSMLDNREKHERSGKTVIDAPFSTSEDKFCNPFGFEGYGAVPASYKDDYRERHHKVKADMGSKTGTMRRKFEQALITKTRSDWVPSTTGRLDVRRRAASIMRADDKIFRKLDEADALDTCVTVLVDCSGSMCGSREQTACAVSTAIAYALEGAGVPVEVLGHTAVPFENNELDEMMREARWASSEVTYSRFDSVLVYEFKPFDKQLRQCQGEMGYLYDASCAHNADPDAILMVANRLAKRSESRKVMLVLSDGHPEHETGYNREELWAATRKAVDTSSKMGIDMVGVGIQYNGVSEFFPDYVVVRNLDDLSRGVMDKLAKLLLGDRFHVDNTALIDVA